MDAPGENPHPKFEDSIELNRQYTLHEALTILCKFRKAGYQQLIQPFPAFKEFRDTTATVIFERGKDEEFIDMKGFDISGKSLWGYGLDSSTAQLMSIL